MQNTGTVFNEFHSGPIMMYCEYTYYVEHKNVKLPNLFFINHTAYSSLVGAM